MAEAIKIKSGHDGFEFGALHAQPQGGRRRGGVVVIQEIFGLDQYVQADVERWAALGFEVVAPSMFDRAAPGFIADHSDEGLQKAIPLAMGNGADNAMSDIQACIDFLKARGPVFIVGYCYGGTMVWLAASRCTGLAAGSSYYGGQIPGLVDIPLSCPVEIHLGRKDAHIPADEVKAKVQAAHPDVPVFIYENSGHGFNNDGRPDSDLADAQLARKRTLALFEANGAA